MVGWRRHEGLAVALPIESIDTDQLLPARFMKEPRTAGYGRFLLHDHRFDAEGRPRSGFPLARPEAEGASILVARRNFGGGSSREAAVYALVDFGVRCVVAPSFGDIFAANAANNGLLPAAISEEEAEHLLASLDPAPRRLAVDLDSATIRGAGRQIRFAIDPVWRQKLIEGWDDIDLTGGFSEAIARFVEADSRRRPWARPRARPAIGKAGNGAPPAAR